MSDEILSLIYTFSKKFSDPETNLSFDPKNQNISAIVKEGNVNISLLVKGQKEDLYINIARLLKNNVEQISGVLSVNVIINSDRNSNKTNLSDWKTGWKVPGVKYCCMFQAASGMASMVSGWHYKKQMLGMA